MASSFFGNLQSEILALSSAKSWPKAVKEWERAGVEKLEIGEESQTCLCGHFPIRELCFSFKFE